MSDTERQVEVPWLLEKVKGSKIILDVGSMDARYLDKLAEQSRELWLADPRLTSTPLPAGIYAFTGRCDNLPEIWDGKFDLVTSISTLDHVGLNAYGQTAEDGLLEATVKEMARVMAPGGRLLVTVPFGRDHVTTHPGGDQRVFDMAALKKLFPASDWEWQSVTFWKLEDDNYIEATQADASQAEYAQWRAAAVIGLELVKNGHYEPPEFYVDATDAAIELAAKHKLDLATITGTGTNGRITKADVEAAIKEGEA